ncbi:heparin lyase I family protein [Bradyrhizobium sp. SSUT18]|uniref:heparin lyase I family protein n=1 Tax=Bradyrhizobium sp. SSUT18 TaxID=3040602 RepID=UPI002449A015|nr:heparin lyase I family protein [Bradyrhizobium sp. SSUT18]MDH2403174.1 heparin lyase I family protein [Bradyrhizobium sp. SSUT18]
MKVLLTVLAAFIATTTADASDPWKFVGAGPSDVHSFAATGTDAAGDMIEATRPASRTVVPSITSFSATPKTRFDIGGDSYQVQTAGKSYSLTNLDPQTLRFEVQPGDKAWYDSGPVDRAEIENDTRIPVGTPINISYEFMVEPNGPNGSFTNTASSYFILGQLHNDDTVGGVPTSPPFYINLVGDHLQVNALYCPTGLNPSNAARNLTHLTLWTDPNPIQAGQYNDTKISANVSNNSSGYLGVWMNGTQVVNYQGPLGFGDPTYWEYGLYRSRAPETVAANFRNMTITTRAAPPGASPRPL